jgi:hypothetical protein
MEKSGPGTPTGQPHRPGQGQWPRSSAGEQGNRPRDRGAGARARYRVRRAAISRQFGLIASAAGLLKCARNHGEEGSRRRPRGAATGPGAQLPSPVENCAARSSLSLDSLPASRICSGVSRRACRPHANRYSSWRHRLLAVVHLERNSRERKCRSCSASSTGRLAIGERMPLAVTGAAGMEPPAGSGGRSDTGGGAATADEALVGPSAQAAHSALMPRHTSTPSENRMIIP